ncbi:MAG TPA: class I SAM-dependent methyltransferase [Gemmataceae bacterium]|jgi:2-polyprenyl-3-methyl-5-hydroxy-6-metoxy-1,4-benzoquinol methylase|nr:class I SAM-dependent methyltransferase [Gemmataceae bacterium]
MIHLHKKQYEYLEEINICVLKQIPANDGAEKKSVLDVGCGSGALSEAIRQKGYNVWGIEGHQATSQIAAKRIDRVLNLDLQDLDTVAAALGDQQFDYLVFSDVLEHIYDPFQILTRYLHFVKPGGRLVISVPNALVWTNRINFVFGRFEYADTGTMDRTHIRWFTFSSAKRLVQAAGCKIEHVDYRPYFIRAALPLMKKVVWSKGTDRRRIIDSPAYRKYLRFIYPVEYAIGYFFKPLAAFQIVLTAVKTPAN